jgi:hypothetical protein
VITEASPVIRKRSDGAASHWQSVSRTVERRFDRQDGGSIRQFGGRQRAQTLSHTDRHRAAAIGYQNGSSQRITYSKMVGMAGFEPATSCSQSRRANQAALHPGGPAVAYLLPVPRSWLHAAGAQTMCRPHQRLPGLGLPGSLSRGRSDQSGTARRYATGLAACARLLRMWPPRGRSSMAEPQPSKLVMRVRFPSPAPTCKPRSGA